MWQMIDMKSQALFFFSQKIQKSTNNKKIKCLMQLYGYDVCCCCIDMMKLAASKWVIVFLF